MPAPPHPVTKPRLLQDLAHPPRIGGRVGTVDQEPGDSVAHDRGKARDVARDDRRTAGLGLEAHQAERLAVRRYQASLGGRVIVRQPALGNRPAELHPPSQAELANELLEAGALAGSAVLSEYHQAGGLVLATGG